MSGAVADPERSFEWCRAVTAARARSFYLGLRLAPEPERSALYALYAWNRTGDDIVDAPSPMEERAESLETFARETDAALRGEPGESSPVWPALAHTAAAYDIPAAWFTEMIDGLRSDLDHTQPADLDELLTYCTRVAGSVGRCCVAVWGTERAADRDRALQLADTLGRAFQITNILRDVGEDAGAQPPRCYVPRSVLDRAGLTHEELVAWRDDDACQRVIIDLARQARQAFAAGDELSKLIRPRFRPTLWAMQRVYERTLSLVESQPRRAVRPQHVRPGRLTAVSIACRAFAMAALTPGDK